VNTFFQPNTVQLHGSASSTPEREEENTCSHKIISLGQVANDLEKFTAQKCAGLDVREMAGLASSTLKVYRKTNESVVRMRELEVRAREIEVEGSEMELQYKKRKLKLELKDEAKRQQLDLLDQAAKVLLNNSCFTPVARHNLAHSVAMLTAPTSRDDEATSEVSEDEGGQDSSGPVVTGGDPEVLQRMGLTACPPAPKVSATKHFETLCGVRLTDRIFEKQLRDSVYSAFKSMYGVEIAQMRGKASKITYTQRELSRLQPVFSRFVELCNVNKVAAPHGA
jgi:hypothetical protein